MIGDEEKARYEELRAIVARLRAPDGGCPWDLEQTHQSLRPHLIEEAYEVLEALDSADASGLPEELGDLLFQILLHTQLAEEAGEFSMVDVLGGLAEKLVRRHPHVFGDVDLQTADQVIEQWDQLKRAERAAVDQPSSLASVPRALPALAYAQSLLRRAEAEGFAWPDSRDVLDKVTEERQELAEAKSPAEATEELGDLLLNIANYARYQGLDAEEALRLAGDKFRRRFDTVEASSRRLERAMSSMSREALIALWQEAKAAEKQA